MPQFDAPLYPGLLVAADIALAVVLVVVAPVLGVLMAAVALSVVAVTLLRARELLAAPRPGVSHDG
ncbi:hypothetical protein [Halobellus ruber]|uniref:Uncharacterized protein n=1 Tax=Halobellus ruber TaxID=2761102 RepID=A0A7J9SFZ4_9EURY|nr:hypothetical protein [Halobellus ruber]MBB6644897.1 hypothetical protein [Halobellus ruber]